MPAVEFRYHLEAEVLAGGHSFLSLLLNVGVVHTTRMPGITYRRKISYATQKAILGRMHLLRERVGKDPHGQAPRFLPATPDGHNPG